MFDLPIWANWAQIVTVPLAVISILLVFRRLDRRDLMCRSELYPVKVKSPRTIRKDIEILYRGEPIDTLFVVRTYVKNIGNADIRSSHVMTPLTLSFDSDAWILHEPTIVFRSASGLQVEVQSPTDTSDDVKTHWIQLKFELKRGEHFTLDMVCTGREQEPQASARIEGVSSPRKKDLRIVDQPYDVALIATILFSIVWALVRDSFVGVVPALLDLVLAGLYLLVLAWGIVKLFAWLRNRQGARR